MTFLQDPKSLGQCQDDRYGPWPLPHCQAPNVVVPLIAPTLCHAPSAADSSAASATQAADHPSAADGASCLPLTTDSRKSRASMVLRSSNPIDVPAPGWNRANSPWLGSAMTVV